MLKFLFFIKECKALIFLNSIELLFFIPTALQKATLSVVSVPLLPRPHIHLNSTFAAKYTGKHGDAMFYEGVREGATEDGAGRYHIL